MFDKTEGVHRPITGTFLVQSCVPWSRTCQEPINVMVTVRECTDLLSAIVEAIRLDLIRERSLSVSAIDIRGALENDNEFMWEMGELAGFRAYQDKTRHVYNTGGICKSFGIPGSMLDQSELRPHAPDPTATVLQGLATEGKAGDCHRARDDKRMTRDTLLVKCPVNRTMVEAAMGFGPSHLMNWSSPTQRAAFWVAWAELVGEYMAEMSKRIDIDGVD